MRSVAIPQPSGRYCKRMRRLIKLALAIVYDRLYPPVHSRMEEVLGKLLMIHDAYLLGCHLVLAISRLTTRS